MKSKFKKILIVILLMIILIVVGIFVYKNINVSKIKNEVKDEAVKICSKNESLFSEEIINNIKEKSNLLINNKAKVSLASMKISKDIAENESSNEKDAIVVEDGSELKAIDSKIDINGKNLAAILLKGKEAKTIIENSIFNIQNMNSKVLDLKNGIAELNNSHFKISGNENALAKINYGEENQIDIKNSIIDMDSDNSAVIEANDANAIVNFNNSKLNLKEDIKLVKVSNKDNNNDNKVGIKLNGNNQELVGDVEVSDGSIFTLNLVNSKYKGTINKENKGKYLSVMIDENSTFSITGDTYLTSIVDQDLSLKNIESNGHVIYYSKNNEAMNWTKGKIIYLFDGGKIVPIEK